MIGFRIIKLVSKSVMHNCRSHPDFKRKLREKRKAANKVGKTGSGPALPDLTDNEAVQRFFFQVVFDVV